MKVVIDFWKAWRREIIFGVGILSLAFILRTYKLTYLPIFGDEAIYIRWAQIMRVEPGLRFVPLSDGKQPLFMWSVIPFIKIFSDPLFAGRIVSALSGVGTSVGVFVLSYLLFKNRFSACVAAFIYALSPYAVFFDRMALVDSMLTFFGVWTLVFAIITSKKARLDSSMIAGFFLGGALLTKSPGIFFVLLLPTVLILAKWPKSLKRRFSKVSVFVFLFSFTYAIAYGMYNILRLGSEFHMVGIRNKDYVYPLGHIFERPFDPLMPFLDRAVEWFWMLGPSVLLVLVLSGIVIHFRKNVKEVVLLAAWAFIPLVVSAEYAKVFTARYLLFIFPYLVVLASVVFLPIGGLLSKNRKRLLGLLFVIFVIHAFWINYLILVNVDAAPLPRSERSGYLEEWTAGTGIYEVSEKIRERHKLFPDQKIVVGTEGYFGTLPNGLQVYLNDLVDITVVGVGLDFSEVPESLLESKRAGNTTYFVVNDSRLFVYAREVGLNLLAAYPKAKRPDGSRETLLFFEVVKVVN